MDLLAFYMRFGVHVRKMKIRIVSFHFGQTQKFRFLMKTHFVKQNLITGNVVHETPREKSTRKIVGNSENFSLKIQKRADQPQVPC